MKDLINYKWRWLSLIGAGFIALVLAVAFAPGVLDQPIAQGPATWGLLAGAAYLVIVVIILGIAVRPFARPNDESEP